MTNYLNYELFVYSVSKAVRQKEYDAFRNNKKSKQSHSSPLSPPRVVQRPVLATVVAMTPSILISTPLFISPPSTFLVSTTDVDSSRLLRPVTSTTRFVRGGASGLSFDENTPPMNSAEVSNIYSIEGLLVAIRDVLFEDSSRLLYKHI